MQGIDLGTQAQGGGVRGLLSAFAALLGPSGRERREKAREAAWRREERTVEDAERRKGEAAGMTEDQWLDLVRGRDGAR